MWGFLSKELFSKSVYLNKYTNVWPVVLFEELIDEIKKGHKIILGGEIFSKELKCTYDSWYYIPQETKSLDENIIMSIEKAEAYLMNYIKRNGDQYYMDISVRSVVKPKY